MDEQTQATNPVPPVGTEGMSKSQMKKLAKLAKIQEKKAAKAAKKLPEGTTAKVDYDVRCKLIDGMRKVYPTLYQPPFPVSHRTWTSLMEHFQKMDLEEMKGKCLDTEVSIIASVSAVRTAGRLGFLTMAFPPEDITTYNGQLGVIYRPEIQILLRPQTLEMATFEQVFKTDDHFPGLQIPEYTIETTKYESDEAKQKATVEFIKTLSRKDARNLDQYYVIGYPGYSDTGERTIYAKHIFPASKNHLMANTIHGAEEHDVKSFTDPAIIHRKPFLRWFYDTDSLRTQHIRSVFQKELRFMLEEMNGMMSVDIPHLLSVASGANAKPFVTKQNDGDIPLMLRIAPELELKMMIVGRLNTEGVYHIGSQFRNEGADTTHNPEFTSVEFYATMKSFYELLKMNETIIRHCCVTTLSKTRRIEMEEYMKVFDKWSLPDITSNLFQKEDDTGFMIDWNKPFVNINFIDGINQNLKDGKTLPDPTTYEDDAVVEEIKALAKENGVDFKPTDSVAKVLDNMFDELVLVNTFRDDLPNSYFKERDADGNLLISPVTVYGHPKVMSPLAMEMMKDGVGTGIVYRFESFVAGMEICNAYQELSDPLVQKKNFESQRKFQAAGDDEAMNQNDTFMTALEYGMMPVAGWGMGLERMYMILSNNYSIKNVLPFPQVK